MSRTQSLGRWGEQTAAQHLEEKGYTILARNQRTPYGEIDLIAQQPGTGLVQTATLVFVEVKTRASRSLGRPEISVSRRKQTHLLASIQHYIQSQPSQPSDWRLDVIAIERMPDEPACITHFENAVSDL